MNSSQAEISEAGALLYALPLATGDNIAAHRHLAALLNSITAAAQLHAVNLAEKSAPKPPAAERGAILAEKIADNTATIAELQEYARTHAPKKKGGRK